MAGRSKTQLDPISPRESGCSSCVLLFSALALLATSACGTGFDEDATGPDYAPEFRSRRPAAAIRLVELPARIRGEARGDAGQLMRWQNAAAPNPEIDVSNATPTSLSLSFGALEDVGALEIALVSGGARRLEVIPAVEGDLNQAEIRLRRIEIPLEKSREPNTEVLLRADLSETLNGNWGDAGRNGRLLGLTLRLVDATTPDAELRSVALFRVGSTRHPYAARSVIHEQRGVMRPTWQVRDGASAEFDLDLPEAVSGGFELRWYDASQGADSARLTEVLVDGSVVAERRLEGAASWNAQRLSLARWRGGSMVVRLSVQGEGVGLFGDPQVVSLAPESPPADVILYMIDTLRADHLGIFGSSARNASPEIDRLASEGLRFSMTLSQSSWTKPSIVTLMSGILPTTHRVGASTISDRVPATVDLVQERFRRAGWRTGSFAANPMGSSLSALERGFDVAIPPRYWRGRTDLGEHPSALQLEEAFLRWLEDEPDRPYFAYIHTLEVHQHTSAVPNEGERKYVAAVRAADRSLGRLLDELARRERLADLLLIVVADHGQAYGRRQGHGTSLLQDQIHVPLIFWSSWRIPKGEISVPVGLVDVAATLLELFGLPAFPESEGESLLALAADPSSSRRQPVPSALLRFPHAPKAPQRFSLVTPDGKKVIARDDGATVAFDLRMGPDGTANRRIQAPDLQRELARRVEGYERAAEEFRERHGQAAIGGIAVGELERLRALGYLE